MTSPVDHNYLKWVEAERNEQDKTGRDPLRKFAAVWGPEVERKQIVDFYRARGSMSLHAPSWLWQTRERARREAQPEPEGTGPYGF